MSSPTLHPSLDNWQTFNALAKRTLQYPAMEKDELFAIFKQIESLIFQGIDTILATTTFVEDNVCHLIAEIAAGVIKSRKVYKGKRVRKRINIADDVEMGAENRRIFGIGFDLFKLSRMERSHALPYVRRIIRTLRISSYNYENILSAFVHEGEKYCDVSDDLAEIALQLFHLQRTPGTEQRTEALSKQADVLIDQLSLIGLRVGCVNHNYLYGTLRSTKSVIRKIRLLQDKILRSYIRLVLKPAKTHSRNEMQALDMFQSGSLGLSRAISLYDFRQGTSFPTFATSWIRQKVLGFGKHSGSLIKLPGSVIEMNQKIDKAERCLESNPETCDTYTDIDVANLCGTTVKSVELVKRKVQGTRVIPLESMLLLNDEGYETEFATDRALLDETIEAGELYASQQEFVDDVLKYLDEPQRNLVCLRYGVVESMTNQIDPKQQLRELFRQSFCKAYLQQNMVDDTADQFQYMRIEELPMEEDFLED